MKFSRGQFLMLGGLMVLAVVMLFLPTKPEASTAEPVAYSEVDAQIDSAIALVNGENPMLGIMMLRKVLEKEPENTRALFQMGIFSVQSGQYEKAVERFKKVVELDPDRPQAYYFLGDAYMRAGDKELALENFQNFLSRSEDNDANERVRSIINDLKE